MPYNIIVRPSLQNLDYGTNLTGLGGKVVRIKNDESGGEVGDAMNIYSGTQPKILYHNGSSYSWENINIICYPKLSTLSWYATANSQGSFTITTSGNNIILDKISNGTDSTANLITTKSISINTDFRNFGSKFLFGIRSENGMSGFGGILIGFSKVANVDGFSGANMHSPPGYNMFIVRQLGSTSVDFRFNGVENAVGWTGHSDLSAGVGYVVGIDYIAKLIYFWKINSSYGVSRTATIALNAGFESANLCPVINYHSTVDNFRILNSTDLANFSPITTMGFQCIFT
jgi:hypothetical protein